MKHIHFVIYRLKSTILFIVIIYYFVFINSFFIICIYSEIEFIKSLDDVKFQRKTITFTNDGYDRTVFINKMIKSGIMRMFIYFYDFYIYIFYFVSQVLCICTNDLDGFSMKDFFFFVMILFFFYLMIWWGIGIASESKLEVLKDGCFWNHNCFFYYFLLFYLIILFYYYSNIPYSRV
jgi:hypothetical protein